MTKAVSGLTMCSIRDTERPPALTGWLAAGAQVEPGSAAVCAALFRFYRTLQTTHVLVVGPR